MPKDRRVSHLASAQALSSSTQSGVRHVTGLNGVVTRLGPTFAEMEEPKVDPRAGLLASLAKQQRARSST